MDPHPSGLRLSNHNALASACVFVARSGHQVVETVTLIVDSALGLPMDEIYAGLLFAPASNVHLPLCNSPSRPWRWEISTR